MVVDILAPGPALWPLPPTNRVLPPGNISSHCWEWKYCNGMVSSDDLVTLTADVLG
jgi:hypothetical protein